MHLSCVLWNFLCFWQEIYPDSQSFPKLFLQHISSCGENKKIKYICTCQTQQRALWSHVVLGMFFYLLFGFFCCWSVQTSGHHGVEEGRTQRFAWVLVENCLWAGPTLGSSGFTALSSILAHLLSRGESERTAWDSTVPWIFLEANCMALKLER